MKTRFAKLGLLGALLALSLGLVAQQAAKPALTKTYPLAGSLYGTFIVGYEGKAAWVGYMYLSIGNEPAKLATFVDRNTSITPRANGGIYGTETITVTFADGSGSFDIPVHFSAAPGATPHMYYVQEHGTITNGTGSYAFASGSVTTQGWALVPEPPLAQPWMAEVHGSISGLSVRD